MPNGHLTKVEAVKSWVLRAAGWKIRDIQKRFDVDPRRLYDVWEEKEFLGTKLSAINLFNRLFPTINSDDLFNNHLPRYTRKSKPQFDEPELPF